MPPRCDRRLAPFLGGRDQWAALDTHWRPFLEGRGTREDALIALARALTGAGGG